MKSFRELDVWQKAMRRGWIDRESLPRELMNDISRMLFALSRKLRTT